MTSCVKTYARTGLAAGTDGTGTPLDPNQYVADFAEALTSVVSDPDRAAAMGRAGRQRAIESFSWAAIAEQTRAIYDGLTR